MKSIVSILLYLVLQHQIYLAQSTWNDDPKQWVLYLKADVESCVRYIPKSNIPRVQQLLWQCLRQKLGHCVAAKRIHTKRSMSAGSSRHLYHFNRYCGSFAVDKHTESEIMWTISVPLQFHINITFIYFNLPYVDQTCGLGKLSIGDLAVYCGRRAPWNTVIKNFTTYILYVPPQVLSLGSAHGVELKYSISDHRQKTEEQVCYLAEGETRMEQIKNSWAPDSRPLFFCQSMIEIRQVHILRWHLLTSPALAININTLIMWLTATEEQPDLSIELSVFDSPGERPTPIVHLKVQLNKTVTAKDIKREFSVALTAFHGLIMLKLNHIATTITGRMKLNFTVNPISKRNNPEYCGRKLQNISLSETELQNFDFQLSHISGKHPTSPDGKPLVCSWNIFSEEPQDK